MSVLCHVNGRAMRCDWNSRQSLSRCIISHFRRCLKAENFVPCLFWRCRFAMFRGRGLLGMP